jgi:hypothetical protein
MTITNAKSIILTSVTIAALIVFNFNAVTITLMTLSVLVFAKLGYNTGKEAKAVKLRNATHTVYPSSRE